MKDAQVPADDEKLMSAMYFVVADSERKNRGYTWRIWWGGTSFYVKGRASSLAAFKVSLHGPDTARPRLRPGFKIAMDESAMAKAEAAGAVYCGSVAIAPQWFRGRRIKDGVTHVLTFRTTWDLFAKGIPPASNPGELRSGTAGLVIPAPTTFMAADLDLYVSDRKPYWPREAKARRDNACVGPIQNRSGQYLTGVSFRRSALKGDAPELALALKSRSTKDRIRGIGTAVDHRGVLWIIEQWMSPSALTKAVEHQKQLTGPAAEEGDTSATGPRLEHRT